MSNNVFDAQRGREKKWAFFALFFIVFDLILNCDWSFWLNYHLCTQIVKQTGNLNYEHRIVSTVHLIFYTMLRTLLVEKFSWIFSWESDFSWNWTKEFYDVSEVVFVPGIVFAGVRLEQVVASRELESHASSRPKRINNLSIKETIFGWRSLNK